MSCRLPFKHMLPQSTQIIQSTPQRLWCLAGLMVLLASTLVAQAQMREVALSKPRQHVNDFAEVVESSTATRLENALANLNDRTGINFVVVTIKTAGQDDLFSLSSSLLNQWTIGSAASGDKSVLLFISTDNATFYTLSSGGAMQALPNGLVGAMGRRMRVMFEQRNFGAGIETGLKLFAEILGQYANFNYESLITSKPITPPAAHIARASFKSADAPAITRNRAGTATAPPPLTAAETKVQLPPVNLSPSSPTKEAIETKSLSTALSPNNSLAAASAARPMKPGRARARFVVPAEKAAPIYIQVLKTRPTIDGILNDEVWAHATVLKDFYQVQPGDNTEPSQPTEVL